LPLKKPWASITMIHAEFMDMGTDTVTLVITK
jgi:hypothetical protein